MKKNQPALAVNTFKGICAPKSFWQVGKIPVKRHNLALTVLPQIPPKSVYYISKLAYNI